MSYPPRPVGYGPPPPAPPAPPEDIRTARQLWWGVIGFGVVQLIASMISAMRRRDEFAQQMLDEVRDSDPNFTMAQAELMMNLAFGIGIVLGLGLAAVGLVFVHQLYRGKLWARTLLTAVAVWLIIVGIGTLFALDAITGAASLVAGGAAIVQGVLAAGALYLALRKDSTEYFQKNRR